MKCEWCEWPLTPIDELLHLHLYFLLSRFVQDVDVRVTMLQQSVVEDSEGVVTDHDQQTIDKWVFTLPSLINDLPSPPSLPPSGCWWLGGYASACWIAVRVFPTSQLEPEHSPYCPPLAGELE